MRKRFALIVARGLVTVLIAASAALSLGHLGAAPEAGGDLAAPRVRTTYHTVTVHRAGVTPSPRTVVLTGSGRSSPLAGEGSGSESEFESDEGSDESHGESEASDD